MCMPLGAYLKYKGALQQVAKCATCPRQIDQTLAQARLGGTRRAVFHHCPACYIDVCNECCAQPSLESEMDALRAALRPLAGGSGLGLRLALGLRAS